MTRVPYRCIDITVTPREHTNTIEAILTEPNGTERRLALTKSLLCSLLAPLRALAAALPLRGSCEVDDLVQAANLAILSGLPKLDLARTIFLPWALRNGRAAMVREIQRQGHDVHLSDYSRRGEGPALERPNFNSQSTTHADPRTDEGAEIAAEALARARGEVEPEHALVAREALQALYAAIRELPPLRKAVIVRLYGLGQPRRSAREICAELRIARATVRQVEIDALALLRNVLDRP